ncbi:hypothetical protein GT002_37405, partial [Streptomyces sp. SID4917]|nr:hypothetical protein [Streptomyces sp. SID4917]
ATPTGRPLAPEGWFRAEEPSVFDRPAAQDSRSADGGPVASVTDGPSNEHRAKDVPQWADDGGEREGAAAQTAPPATAKESAKGAKDAKEKKRASAARRKPRGARFAGLDVEEETEAAPAPVVPAP